MRIKLLFFCMLCAIVVNVHAQVPQQINYQAVIRNTTGAPVTNQAISLKFTFYANAANGTIEYSETQSVTTNSFGLVNLQIGTGTPVAGSWSAIDWKGAIQFLGVAADLTGGNTYTELSNSKLSSVPYAIQAEHSADNKWTTDGQDIINNNTGAVGIGAKPDASAALDITANGKGLLIPRMTQAELPLTPAEGLLVYQTDNTPGFYYYSGGQWHSMNGNQQTAPAGTIIPFATGQVPAALAITLGGVVSTGSAIGFGYNTPVNITGGQVDITPSGNAAFVIPRAGTITSISGFFSTTSALSLIGSTVMITGQLYQALGPNSNQFVPIPGAIVMLNPGFTGLIPIGATISGSSTGLSIPVTAGTRLMMVYSASVTGLDLVLNITGHISGGLNIQ